MTDYDNDLDEMEVTCDDCHTKKTYQGTFQECIDQMKDDDWHFRKERAGWEHVCDSCWDDMLIDQGRF